MQYHGRGQWQKIHFIEIMFISQVLLILRKPVEAESSQLLQSESIFEGEQRKPGKLKEQREKQPSPWCQWCHGRRRHAVWGTFALHLTHSHGRWVRGWRMRNCSLEICKRLFLFALSFACLFGCLFALSFVWLFDWVRGKRESTVSILDVHFALLISIQFNLFQF